MLTLMAVCCLAGVVRADAATVPDTLGQRLKACSACHGAEGRAVAGGYAPRLAGKPAGYLYNQLINFRDGRRHYREMTRLVRYLPDSYLHQIADYYAARHPPYPPAMPVQTSPETLMRGRHLVERGDPVHHIPACAVCHGQRLTGRQPAVPGLVGLSRDYIVAQIGEWQSGARNAAPPDCMAKVAQRLSVAQIDAVSAWLASRPLPADLSPAPPAGRPLPLRCGSLGPQP